MSSGPTTEVIDPIARLSHWIDSSPGYTGIGEEAHLWRRVTKAGAEYGETLDAMSGMLGENPRKGKTHTLDDVVEELLDTAIAALGAVEHIKGNTGVAQQLLAEKVHRILVRAGLEPESEKE